MLTLRPAQERGATRLGWLNSQHTFSFGQYYDPKHMGVSILRVINDDTVIPGAGFSPHDHNDMEIVSYVLAGALQHKDSMGNGSVIKPGNVQRMSAGTGVQHSEYNASQSEPVHFLQIWLEPNAIGVEPGYQEKYFDPEARRGRLVLLVSPDGREGSIGAHQDGLLYGTLLGQGEAVALDLASNRQAYVHVVRGSVSANGQAMAGGDGAVLRDVSTVQLLGQQGEAEVLVFDLP
jgi:redox-sensitive bicupin YhaK (pirin superfamily)